MAQRLDGARAVVFDGDDTLWATEPLYDAARDAARCIVEQLGLDGAAWDSLERQIDVVNAQTYGLGVGRFPLSCVQAYERMAEGAGMTVSEEARSMISAAAGAVFTSVAPVYQEADRVLAALQPQWHLLLCTRGDPGVQRARIEASGLKQYFDLVSVVPQKSESVFRKLLADVKADPPRSWSVGNSVRSDIAPAVAAGMSAIWVPATVWEYEQSEPPAPSPFVFTVTSLGAVVEVLATRGH